MTHRRHSDVAAGKYWLLLLALVPAVSFGWWNDAWKQRTAITLNTSSAGVAVQGVLSDVAVPVRLHSGNFDFIDARPDGSDVRVVAGDDKTPLKFWIERFDGVNEIGIVWVLVPKVLPATDKNTLYVYAGNESATKDAAATQDPAAVVDGATLAAFHFAEKDGIAADQTGAIKAAAPVAVEPNGLVGQSAKLTGTAISWPASDKLKAPSGGPYGFTIWIRPDTPGGVVFSQGPLQAAFADGKLEVKLGSLAVPAVAVPAATWSQLGVVIGSGKLAVYVDGAAPVSVPLPAASPAIEGPIQVGDQFSGLVDELEIMSSERSDDWFKLSHALQGADAKLIATKLENAGSESSSGGSSYIGILVKSLTPDALAVIGLLLVMLIIAVAVMINKSIYVSRTDKANQLFLKSFRESADVMQLAGASGPSFDDSSLFRLYSAGLRELHKRLSGPKRGLSDRALDAVKAAIDADSVREGYILNARMVLLTIAISGGPFLGLLGTVIGVMITFASIAAAGDVNVNAIAPGIAAALLATVTGLAVAIPSLFGYNYLASRIKTVISDMQIFIDEFLTRIAESQPGD